MALSVISDIDLRVVRLSFPDPVRLGRDRIAARETIVVRVIDEHGLMGLGETMELPHPDAMATARSWAVARTPDELHASGGPWSLGVLPLRLCGALDSALTDLRARQAGIPAAVLMGGAEARSDVRANALLVVRGPGDEAAAGAARLVTEGFDTLKLKLDGAEEGIPEPWWLDALVAARDAAGASTAIRLDLNGALDPDAARAWLPTLADLELEYVEQPIAPAHGVDALVALRDAGPPIAADESVTDIGAALDLIEAGCDVLVVKPGRVGGPLRAHAITEAATEGGVPVTISTLHEAGVGLAAAIHLAATVPGDRAHGLATAHLATGDPVEGLPAVRRGRIAVPGPGLGVTLA
jgi:L-alanine-DL-glutamate epimerase-like enolase superfamily enzyme